MNAAALRARQLMAQGRWREAAEQLRTSLADDPQDATAHAALSLCLANAGEPREALREAEAALACDADCALARFARASALLADRRTAEAEAAAHECLAFTPDDADCHALIAQCRMLREDRPGALSAAEAGLAVDPGHAACRALRGQALMLLGRRDEAAAQHAADLAQDPDDALAHANAGYARLHANRPREAALHFAEALRLDPEDGYARQGLVEALKARHGIYRVFLAYGLWMARLSPGTRWLVVIGGYLVYRVADRVGEVHPELAVWLAPLAWGYFAFALTTWLAEPLFNLALMADPMGRYALSAREKTAALVAGSLALLAGALAIASLWGAIWLLAAFALAMLAPLWNAAIDQAHPRLRRWLPIATGAASALAWAALVLIASEQELGARMWTWFTWSWLGLLLAPRVLPLAGR